MAREIGLRRRPVLGFLPRASFINKYLGMLRHKVSQKRSEDFEDPHP